MRCRTIDVLRFTLNAVGLSADRLYSFRHTKSSGQSGFSWPLYVSSY
jgi:hypothetical protein